MHTWKRLLVTTLALGAGSLVACGDGGGSGDAPDASGIDAEVPDVGPPVQTRSATIAVTDIALTSAQGAGQGWRGAAVSAVFEDVTTGGGTVTFGTTPVGGCVVVEYDAAHPANPTVDAGTITISGDGILKPLGPCSYTNGSYVCTTDADAAQDVTVTPAGGGAVVYTFADQDFTGIDYIGSYLNINGLANAGNNSGASAFPIVQQAGANALTVLNPAATAEAVANGAGAFAVLNGVGPIPTAFGGNADFLDNALTSVTIEKPEDADWSAIDFTTYTRGDGFALADASAKPHQFPDTAANAMTFTCTGAGGECGEEGELTLEAIIISGKTTDTPVSSLPLDFLMPPPTTTWAEFQCGFLLADSGSIPTGAIQAILDTNPTRIETRVLRVTGQQAADANNELNTSFVVVGHGLVGHTTL